MTITPDGYVSDAIRTKCDTEKSLKKLILKSEDEKRTAITLLHSVLGMVGELGEIAGALERWIFYNAPLDRINLKEELGDLNWYEAEALDALNFRFSEVLEANINKLRTRYPVKFSEENAKEENRDREQERKDVEGETLKKSEGKDDLEVIDEIFSQTGQGWSEPPLEVDNSFEPSKSETFIVKDRKDGKRVKDGFDVAREIAQSYAEGQNLTMALKTIDQYEGLYFTYLNSDEEE